MPKQLALSNRLPGILLIMVVSAALILSLSLAYYRVGGRFVREATVVLQSDNLTVLAGQGERVADGLAIRRVSEQGFALVSGPTVSLPASFYPELEWQIDGLQAQTTIRFVWTTKAAPYAMKGLSLQHGGGSAGRVRLADIADWQGIIGGVGLIIQEPSPPTLTVRRLVLRPVAPGAGILLAQMWDDWTTFEGWKGYSINFIVGGIRGALFPPVVAAAAWVGLSAVIYAGLIFVRRQSWSLQPFMIFFLAGWLALDTRWQWDLWRQLDVTYARFAGKSWEEKRLAGEDGRLFQFIQEVKKKLPKEPVRLFLISAEPQEGTNYLRSRAHYHLLPHNVYSLLSRPPSREQTRKWDYLLILWPVQNVRYDSDEQVLRWGGGNSLPIDALYSTPIGTLFKVRHD